MKKDSALGFIETVGLASSIVAADAALKAANVELIGREISKGQGWVTIKITGDVAAVQAAVRAAKTALAAAVAHTDVIPRPAAGLVDVMVRNKETTLNQGKIDEPISYPAVEEKAPVEENIPAEEPPEELSEEQPREINPEPNEEQAAADEESTAEESAEDTENSEHAEHIENAPKQEEAPPKNVRQHNKYGKRRK